MYYEVKLEYYILNIKRWFKLNFNSNIYKNCSSNMNGYEFCNFIAENVIDLKLDLTYAYNLPELSKID